MPRIGSGPGNRRHHADVCGEELDVLSIASRREESARQAPAVANVITREMMETRGMYTVSQALSQMPGFYMAKKEWGSRPYLRGIPDSVLFLYDTVPMQSDLSKSVHPLDEELSLPRSSALKLSGDPGLYSGVRTRLPVS
ncbi:MAG: Plug domain-containing protein [Desulfobacterales bacterium]